MSPEYSDLLQAITKLIRVVTKYLQKELNENS